MKQIINLLSIAALLILGAGCAKTVTHLKMNPKTGEIAWDSPKNVKIKDVTATCDTNGVRTINVTGFETKNDPDVLHAAGDANVNMVNAVGTQLRGAFKDGIEAAGSAAKKP